MRLSQSAIWVFFNAIHPDRHFEKASIILKLYRIEEFYVLFIINSDIHCRY